MIFSVACRKCGREETLPHVINHCMVHSTLMKRRHDAIVKRVKDAVTSRFQILSENTAIGSSLLRPDLVIKKGREIIVLDITVTFGDSMAAFESARRIKLEKYAALAAELSAEGCSAYVDAVVVDALGAWDPANDRTLRRLCSRKYLGLMRKLMVSETIEFTRDIYIEHISGIPQCSGGVM